MANFPTHIAIGTLVSGSLATITLAADVVANENLVAVTLAGVLGSVLPDIDLKDSKPSRAMFSGLAIFFSFIVLFTVAGRYSIAEMFLMWLGTLLLVRYGGKMLFHHFSYHRGIWHSILATVFSAFLTAAVYKHLLGRHDGVAWLAAAFMAAGFLTHLILDEIYSVDVSDVRLKQSFGTALKFVDPKHWGQTSAMAIATVLVFLITPSTKTFVEGISSKPLWTSLTTRLWPTERDRWFGIDFGNLAHWTRGVATRAASPRSSGETNPVTTGTLPDRSDPAIRKP
jgi:hypothetical protein